MLLDLRIFRFFGLETRASIRKAKLLWHNFFNDLNVYLYTLHFIYNSYISNVGNTFMMDNHILSLKVGFGTRVKQYNLCIKGDCSKLQTW